ncbi:MAG TPA: VirB4 family type IV secretion/conjugal transfer ATPase [Pseudomonadales bacterium]|nr:VirB4 family type IV secretion/conjugal transfer ATPase [Pseudomonadales bacterium]
MKTLPAAKTKKSSSFADKQATLKFGAIGKKEVPTSRHIPYSHHIDPTTLGTFDGLMLKVIKLKGFAHETADQQTLNYLQEKRNTLLLGLNDSRYAIWTTLVRHKQTEFPQGEFDNAFCDSLNREYQSRMRKKSMFVNDLYITVIRKGTSNKISKISDLVKALSNSGNLEAKQQERKELRSALEEVCERILANLASYSPHLLGTRETAQGVESEILEFLSLLVNGKPSRVLIPRQAINAYLPNTRPFFTTDAFELKGVSHRRIGGGITIKEYPGITKPGIFDELLTLPVEFILTQSFVFVDRNSALGKMKTQKRQLESAGDDARSLTEELLVAMDDVASGRICLGTHHFTLICFEENLQKLQRALALADSALGNQGINAVREDIALEAGFWAQLPGNISYIGRKADITSQNFAAFSSFHNYPCGQLKENLWGDAVTLLETVSGTPYYFNFHKGDLGNTTVIGPSGSGKTVLLTFLQAQLEKYRPRRVYLDKDRGAEIFIRAIGGQYAAIEPGIFTGFNPFQLPENPRNESFLTSLLSFMLSERGEPLNALDMQHVVRLVKGNFSLPARDRVLPVLASYLPQGHDNHLAVRLRRWYGEGDLAWLFDNATDRFPSDTRTIGFDLTHILDEPIARAAALRYMFYRIENLIDGSPLSITLDEGWKGLEDEYVAQKVFDWEKTIRKRNGMVIFGSQSARDLSETRIGNTIIEQSPTQIFYPNPDADRNSYCEAFSLTNKEFDLIKNRLDPASRCFLVKHGKDSIVARLDLQGMEDWIAVLSGREETVRLLDNIRLETGDNPDLWLPLFHQRRKTL